MSACAHPSRGVFGCPYQAHGSEPEPERCYHHSKVAAHVYACGEKGCALHVGHHPPCSPVPPERRTMSADAVLSDEQQELVRVLRDLRRDRRP